MGKYRVNAHVVRVYGVTLSVTQSHAVAWQHEGLTSDFGPGCLFLYFKKTINKTKEDQRGTRGRSGVRVINGFRS